MKIFHEIILVIIFSIISTAVLADYNIIQLNKINFPNNFDIKITESYNYKNYIFIFGIDDKQTNNDFGERLYIFDKILNKIIFRSTGSFESFRNNRIFYKSNSSNTLFIIWEIGNEDPIGVRYFIIQNNKMYDLGIIYDYKYDYDNNGLYLDNIRNKTYYLSTPYKDIQFIEKNRKIIFSYKTEVVRHVKNNKIYFPAGKLKYIILNHKVEEIKPR